MVHPIYTDKAPKPFSAYSQAVQIPPEARILHISGQVGVTPEGELAGGEEAQHRQTWRNIFAILEAGGMDRRDIIDVHAYVTRSSGIATYRKIRDEMLEGVRPASTLLCVAGLADPAWLVEIAVVAAHLDT